MSIETSQVKTKKFKADVGTHFLHMPVAFGLCSPSFIPWDMQRAAEMWNTRKTKFAEFHFKAVEKTE